MAASSSALVTAVVIDLIACLIFLTIFSVLRRVLRKFYAPKRYLESQKVKPKDLGWGLFSWVLPVLTYKEDDLVPSTGLDAAVYLRLLSFGWDLFFWLSVVCLSVVLPVNMRGVEIDRLLEQQNRPAAPPPPPDLVTNTNCSAPVPHIVVIQKYGFTRFDKTSLANIPPGSDLMWVHIVWVYLVTAITLRLLWTYSKDIVGLRVAYAVCSAHTCVESATAAHTVLITDIPCVGGGGGVLSKVASKLRRVLTEGSMSGGGKRSDSDLQLQMARVQREESVLLDVDNDGDDNGDGQFAATPGASGGRRHLDGGGGGGGGGGSASHDQQDGGSLFHDSVEKALAAKEMAVSSSGGRREWAQSSQPGGGLRLRSKPPGFTSLPFTLTTKSLAATHPELDPRVDAQRLVDAGVTPEELVCREIEAVYGPGCIACVRFAHRTEALAPLATEFEALKTDLDDYADELGADVRRGRRVVPVRKLVWGPLYGKWGKDKFGWKPRRVDFCDFAIERMDVLAKLIVKAQATVKEMPVAFVTFRELTHCVTAATALHHHDETAWRLQPAPRPSDLVRANLSRNYWSHLTRGLVGGAAFWLSVAFFMIPIAAIQALIEVPKLSRISWLAPIVQSHVIKPLLEAFVPGLALKIFLVVVPHLLRILALQAGGVSIGVIDAAICNQYYIFQLVTVFFGSIVAGSFFNQVEQFLVDPSSFITVLGTAIPMTSTFFFTFIFISGVVAQPLSLMRLPHLLLHLGLCAATRNPRARERLWQEHQPTWAPWSALYGPEVPQHTIIILLGVVFSVINPCILPVCLIYFIVQSLTERYNRLYVLRPQYESGGLLWRAIFGQVLVGLYIMHLTLIGILGLKKFPYATLLLPAPVITAIFQAMVASLYSRPWSQVSMHDAGTMKSLLPPEIEDAISDAMAAQSAPDRVGSSRPPPHDATTPPMRVGDVYREPCLRLNVPVQLAAATRTAVAIKAQLAAVRARQAGVAGGGLQGGSGANGASGGFAPVTAAAAAEDGRGATAAAPAPRRVSSMRSSSAADSNVDLSPLTDGMVKSDDILP